MCACCLDRKSRYAGNANRRESIFVLAPDTANPQPVSFSVAATEIHSDDFISRMQHDRRFKPPWIPTPVCQAATKIRVVKGARLFGNLTDALAQP